MPFYPQPLSSSNINVFHCPACHAEIGSDDLEHSHHMDHSAQRPRRRKSQSKSRSRETAIEPVPTSKQSAGSEVEPIPMRPINRPPMAVLIALDEQAGLVGVSNGIDVSAAPEGGSFAVGLEGVSMVFAKPVPSGATLVVETIHLETETGDLGVDSFTAIVP